nr:MAG TPA: hypothetical protein [Crassvirales sp.]
MYTLFLNSHIYFLFARLVGNDPTGLKMDQQHRGFEDLPPASGQAQFFLLFLSISMN